MFRDLNKGQAGGRLKTLACSFIGCFVSIYISFAHDGHFVSLPRLLDFFILRQNDDRRLLGMGDHSWRTASAPSKPAPKSVLGISKCLPLISGINFTNRLSEDRSLTNQIFLNGSGVSAGDIDGDGWVDLYFCGLDSPIRSGVIGEGGI